MVTFGSNKHGIAHTTTVDDLTHDHKSRLAMYIVGNVFYLGLTPGERKMLESLTTFSFW